MSATNDRVAALALVLLAGAVAAPARAGSRWVDLPPEGIVIEGEILRSVGRGTRVNVAESLNVGHSAFPTMKELHSPAPRGSGILRLEDKRRALRDAGKGRVVGKSLLDIGITHLAHEKAQDSISRQKAREASGGKKRSLGARLLRGLFR